MLTEGWDCSTVTHIIGLRPFMSQLLCEQVVGRGLRRASYEIGTDGLLGEEVAKVLGVPFEVIPLKENKGGTKEKPEKRHHVYAVPQKSAFEIKYPRVEGYGQAIRNRVTVDWENVSPLRLDPMNIPPEVQMKGALLSDRGRPSLMGPGALENVTLNPYRKDKRVQQLAFELAKDVVRKYVDQPKCEVPPHVLFPQVAEIVHRYLKEYVRPVAPAELVDVFCSPYYGWVYERLVEAIQPDTTAGEAPEIAMYEKNREAGSTADVSFWTSKDVREVVHCHLNYAAADTKKWEQSAAVRLDKHPSVLAFVKNEQLGFTIPYLHNGEPHDYIPDYLVHVKQAGAEQPLNLIFEVKGFDPLKEIKKQAAERWVSAVNAEGSYGKWAYRRTDTMEDVDQILAEVAGGNPLR
jgi:type III restriction enzyme